MLEPVLRRAEEKSIVHDRRPVGLRGVCGDDWGADALSCPIITPPYNRTGSRPVLFAGRQTGRSHQAFGAACGYSRAIHDDIMSEWSKAMVPAPYTLEVADRARMDDRRHEAEQRRLMRLSRQRDISNINDRMTLFGRGTWRSWL